MDLRMRFRGVVSWSKSLSKICNGKSGLKLHSTTIKWFFECLYFSFSWISLVLVWCHQLKVNVFNPEEFGWGCWKLHRKFFESVVLNLWFIGCCVMFHMYWWLIVLHNFSLIFLGCHYVVVIDPHDVSIPSEIFEW